MNAAPTSTGLEGDNAIHHEDVYDTLIDFGANMTIGDPDNLNFAGGTLRIQIGNARTNEDNLVRFVNGNRMLFNPGHVTPIGTVSVGEDADVIINLSASATAASVQQFLRQLYYFNPANVDPTPGPRPITVTLTDGAGGTLVINSTVTVLAINDRPWGADVSKTVATGGTYAFAAADFGFSDGESHNFVSVVFSRLPARGTIYLDADGDGLNLVPVAEGESVGVEYLDGRLVYAPEGDPADLTPATIGFAVRDDGGTADGGEDISAGNSFTFEFSAGGGGAGAPVITGLEGDEQLFREGSDRIYVDVGSNAEIADDLPHFAFHEFNVSIASGYRPGDILMLAGAVQLSSGPGGYMYAIVDNQPIGRILSIADDEISILLNDYATPYRVGLLLKSVAFVTRSETLPATEEEREIRFFVGDHEGNDAVATASVFVRGEDSPTVAGNDYAEVDEDKIVTISILANDYDRDSPLVVREIDGMPIEIGQTVTLSSGARVTLNPDGTLTYDPNGKFASLAGAGLGAANVSQIETFSYRLQGGESYAAVDVRISGVASPGDRLEGNAGDDVVSGSGDRDMFMLHQGGDDDVSGHGGVDSFYFGSAFTAADRVDGGSDRDSVLLQGNYRLTFGTDGVSNIAGIESISLVPGLNESFGDTAGNLYSYDLTLLDGNVAAGALMKINGFHLEAGENFILDGSAESDAPLQIFGGRGVDDLTGGAMGDAFVFGHDGRFGMADKVDGGAGYDLIYLRGDYVLDLTSDAFIGAIANVESIALLTSANTEFAAGGDGDFDYRITLGDRVVAPGATLTVNASRLQAHETFEFDGSAVTNGRLRLFGGAGEDRLAAGSGNDQLNGGGGRDELWGGAGSDLFRFSKASDSALQAPDLIHDFAAGTDRIDLSRIDARSATAGDNEAFAYIGSAAFSAGGPGAPGELRVGQDDLGLWFVEGDIDGDGAADFMILVAVENGASLGVADFVL